VAHIALQGVLKLEQVALEVRGGLQYDYGLDEGDGPGDTTIVTLMDHGLWQTVRNDLTNPSPSFDITPDCIVAIPGRG
jgi:hypothetical protein